MRRNFLTAMIAGVFLSMTFCMCSTGSVTKLRTLVCNAVGAAVIE